MSGNLTLPNKSLVAVVWADAHGSATDTYGERDIPHAPVYIATVGWELRSDEEGISVSNEFCGDADYRGITFIPRALVKSVLVLKAARKPRGRKVERAQANAAVPAVV